MKLHANRKASRNPINNESGQLVDNNQALGSSSSEESDLVGAKMTSPSSPNSLIDAILNATPTRRPIRCSVADSSMSSGDYYDTISYNSGSSSDDEEFESACDYCMESVDTTVRNISPSSTFSTCSSLSLRSETPPKHPTKTLFVGNLAVEVTEAMLNELFSQFGVVVECCKRWYHYAFIQYSSEPEAQRALQALDGHRIQGRAMRVEFQRKKLKTILRSSEDSLGSSSKTAIHNNFLNSSSSTRENVNGGFSPYFQSSSSVNYYRKAIYVSVNQTDSYFTHPGERVIPCIDYKAYELFPSIKENSNFQLASEVGCLRTDRLIASRTQNRVPFGNNQLMNEMFPALGDSSQDSLKAPNSKKPASDSEDCSTSEPSAPKRRYVHALRLLQG